MITVVGKILLLISLIFAAIQAQSFNGTWTTYYGGNFFICVEPDGTMNGVYSEFGYVRGTASGNIATGQWFQTGSNAADLNGNCCTPNWGSFTFNLQASNSFTGSYLFSDRTLLGDSWSGTRTGAITPLAEQCWRADSTLTASLAGRWDTDTGYWDQCIDNFGRWTVSYEYGNNVRGYATGQCFFAGQFCHGDWFEPNAVTGGYMVRLLTANDMIGSWWQVNASDFDSTTYALYRNDPGYHGTEQRIRIGEARDCSRNADLFVDPSVLSPGAIAGIVIGSVCGAFLIALVIVCLICPPRCATGTGGGRRLKFSRSHRHGFGGSHRRYGGGYS